MDGTESFWGIGRIKEGRQRHGAGTGSPDDGIPNINIDEGYPAIRDPVVQQA